MKRKDEWTPAQVTKLIALWKGKMSVSAIGIKLGKTKDSVSGKAHRLDLPRRMDPIPKKAKKPKPAPPSPKPQEASLEPSSYLPRLPSVLACCWPLGNPGEPGFHFCEERALPNRPYCAKHHKIAYHTVRVT